MTKAAPDPLEQDLKELWNLYQQLAGQIQPGQSQGGRRPQPASRPPLQIDPVSHMHELQRYLAWWINGARWRLHPVKRINLTDRENITCPYCQGALVAWIPEASPDNAEVVCINPEHPHAEGPSHWTPREWPRLGVMLGTYEDGRYGPRLPDVASG